MEENVKREEKRTSKDIFNTGGDVLAWTGRIRV
jgi:hypothetical protein